MNKERQFDEQEAPLKNTDHAFVQVSEDGSPKIPGDNSSREQHEEQSKIGGRNEQSSQQQQQGK